nr:MAG TPA: hypothetical protein [Caudoviricetes sp.]
MAVDAGAVVKTIAPLSSLYVGSPWATPST